MFISNVGTPFKCIGFIFRANTQMKKINKNNLFVKLK